MFKKIKILCEKKHYNLLILLFFGLLFATFFELIGLGSIPIFSMAIVDLSSFKQKLSPYINVDFLNSLSHYKIILYGALILTITFVVKNLYLAFIIYIQGLVQKELKVSIGLRLFKQYISAPYTFHLNRNPAILLRTITADSGRATRVIFSLIILLRELLILVTIFTLLFIVDPVITFYVFCSLSIFVGIFFYFTKRGLKERGQIVQDRGGEQIKIVNQSLGAIKDVKILNRENFLEKIFDENIGVIEKNMLLNYFFVQMPRLFLEVICIIAVVVVSTVFLYMERSIISIIPIISLLAVSTIRLIPSFNTIATSLAAIRQLLPSFNLVTKEISEMTSIRPIFSNAVKKNAEFSKDIYFKNVNFQYPNVNVFSIFDLNLKINHGEKIGFIGDSGAGKSTLIDLLLGLLQTTSGNIIVDNKNISENLRNWQNQIGYVPQDIYLLDDTIKKNIAFGIPEKNIDNKKLLKSIEMSQLKEFINSLPDGEHTIVGNRGIRLSGGQKQRIGIARALYNNRKILILDEATSSLDINNEKKVMEEIFSLGGSRTLIIVTHRHQTVQNCDNVFLLDKGKLLEQGKYEYLNNKYNLNEFIKKKD